MKLRVPAAPGHLLLTLALAASSICPVSEPRPAGLSEPLAVVQVALQHYQVSLPVYCNASVGNELLAPPEVHMPSTATAIGSRIGNGQVGERIMCGLAPCPASARLS